MGGGDNEVKPTAYEKELANLAMNELKVHQTKMAPFRNQFIADVTRPTGIAENRVAGEINANFAQAGKNRIVGDPSMTGKAITTNAQDTGRTQGYAAVSATQAVRDNRLKGLQAGLNLSQGLATEAMSGISGLAGTATKNAIAATEDKISRSNAIGSAVGSLAGGAAAAYKNGAFNFGSEVGEVASTEDMMNMLNRTPQRFSFLD